jgi:hypothetical protein
VRATCTPAGTACCPLQCSKQLPVQSGEQACRSHAWPLQGVAPDAAAASGAVHALAGSGQAARALAAWAAMRAGGRAPDAAAERAVLAAAAAAGAWREALVVLRAMQAGPARALPADHKSHSAASVQHLCSVCAAGQCAWPPVQAAGFSAYATHWR